MKQRVKELKDASYVIELQLTLISEKKVCNSNTCPKIKCSVSGYRTVPNFLP